MKPKSAAIGVLGLTVWLLSALPLRADTSGKVKVFILAGQSNMEGKADMDMTVALTEKAREPLAKAIKKAF